MNLLKILENTAPYRQSERKEIYQPLIDQLLASNRAYKCYCKEEELEAEREAQRAREKCLITQEHVRT